MSEISRCKLEAKPISCINLHNGNALRAANTRQLLQAFGLVQPSIGTKPQNPSKLRGFIGDRSTPARPAILNLPGGGDGPHQSGVSVNAALWG